MTFVATLFFTWLCVLMAQVTAFSHQYLACQLEKFASTSPLLGCPSGTIFVSQSDPRAHFKSVQAAVLSLCVLCVLSIHHLLSLPSQRFQARGKATDRLGELRKRPETRYAIILVGAGDYHETVNVTRTGPLTLLV